MNTTLMYLRIRNICGILGIILPFLAIFSVMMINNRPDGALNSISATYYNSSALAAILTAAAIVLMTYDGYSIIDNIVTTTAGVLGIGIVLFPCEVKWLKPTTPVGFFQIPMNISNLIHCTCASLFFLLLAINCLFLFTKTSGTVTSKKRTRNLIYEISGYMMLLTMGIQAINSFFNFFPNWFTMINEIILLFLFGFSWLVKGRAIPFLNDY